MSEAQDMQTQMVIDFKACTRCGDVLPRSLEWFEKRIDGHTLDGLTSWCRPCMNLYRKELYHSRPEVIPIEGGEKVCSACLKNLPRTFEYFAAKRRGSKDGFNGRCRKCLNDYQRKISPQKPSIVKKKEKRAEETKLGVWSTKWRSIWCLESNEVIREKMIGARDYATSMGCSWLADDAAQMCAIEFLQRGACSYRLAVLKLIEQTIGKPGSVRRMYNAEIDQKELEELYSKISDEENAR